MKPEYDAIAAAGFVLQLDCPDLAMARHTGFQELDAKEFLRRATSRRGAERRGRAISRPTQCGCTSAGATTKGRTIHDIPLEEISPIVLRAQARGDSFEAANPRHGTNGASSRTRSCPTDKVLVPGVHRVDNELRRAPGARRRSSIVQFADLVGRERVHRGHGLRLRHVRRVRARDPGIAYKKLAALVEGAARATRELLATRRAQLGDGVALLGELGDRGVDLRLREKSLMSRPWTIS